MIAGLLRLVTVDEQGRPTRWRVNRDELPDHMVAELNAFIARRLLTTDNGTVVIGVAHEKFLSAWPGHTLATGGVDTILWDVTSQGPPRRLGLLLPSNPLSGNPTALHGNPNALSVAFSPDGRTVAVSAGNGTVDLWDLADLDQVRDHAVQRACSVTHGGLDRDEWDRRIPDLPYQDSCPPDGG